jgi:hypothetical protein
MKPFLCLVLLTTMLTGCSRQPSTSVPKLSDRVFTVDEFLAQPDLRKKVSAVCRNDPGRMGATPNCVNVRGADHIASMGTADSLHINMTD